VVKTADPRVVANLRSLLDGEAVGIDRALPLAVVASRLGVHSRRVSEAMAELAAEGYGSVAGRGLFKIANEDERRIVIRAEAHRLVSVAARLDGYGWRDAARDLRQLALRLDGERGTA
jgi:Mn-dependent DtxR family transcriptional regulator